MTDHLPAHRPEPAASYLGAELRAANDHGAPWTDMVAAMARPGNARFLTAAILRLYPDLALVDVVDVIAPACSEGLARPTPGACQTVDAGLAAIDVRGPGWVDNRYPIDAVIPELVVAGFGPGAIVALFNGNVSLQRLRPALQAVCGDDVVDVDHEAVGPGLARRWRCSLRCCQPRRRLLRPRLAAGGRNAGAENSPPALPS